MQLYEQPIETGDDVFLARQRGRQVAAIVGFEAADQVRVATALSEVGRDIVSCGRTGRVTYDIDLENNLLVILVEGFTTVAEADAQGAAAARRLMNTVVIDSTDQHVRVVLRRRLPQAVLRADLQDMRARLDSMLIASPLDELRSQNRQLVETLDAVQAARQALQDLNEELEETNRGVMAMYAQLSDELEETNRGVVALYAELDDTTRKLRAVSEAKTRFLSSIGHELRSPITSIVGLSELLNDADSPPDDDERRRGLALISGSARELLDLVTQLLDLAKAESGRLEPDTAPQDIVPILADVTAALSPIARAGVELRLSVTESAIVLDTDDKLLRQVVRNLVGNAIAFTEAGVIDVVATCGEAGDVTIQVIDSGIGIAAEHLDRIFEEFFQVRGPQQRGRHGTGLGLPYARRVAQLLGGELHAASTTGAGSTFTVSFPPGSRRPVPVHERHPEALAVPCALIVDDDDSFRPVLARLLQPFVHEVLEASDGEEALGLMRQRHVDVVFVDLSMPGMSGEDVLRHMAEDVALDRTSAVVVTSHYLDERERLSLARAIAVLSKDELTTSVLAAAVRRAQEAP